MGASVLGWGRGDSRPPTLLPAAAAAEDVLLDAGQRRRRPSGGGDAHGRGSERAEGQEAPRSSAQRPPARRGRGGRLGPGPREGRGRGGARRAGRGRRVGAGPRAPPRAGGEEPAGEPARGAGRRRRPVRPALAAPRHAARRAPRGRAARRGRAPGAGGAPGSGWRGLPLVPGPERLLASGLQLRVLRLLLRDLLPAVLLPGPEPAHHREAAEALPGLQSQDHSGHRLGRDPLRRRGRHHHLLLPLLLLLPLPPAPAAAEPVRRPGDPHDRRPCAATVPIPPGPQSWPRTPTAWLHVPTQRSCTPVSTLPGGTPRLQPCSSSPVRATPALLPWSLRSQLRLCRPSEAEPPPGPGGGQGHLLARPQAQLHPETFWEWSPREEEQELSWDSAVTEGRVGRAWDTRTIFIRSGGRAGKPAWPLLSPALLPGRRPGRLGPSCSSAVDGGEGGAGLGRLHQPWAEAPPPAAPRPALGGIKAKVT